MKPILDTTESVTEWSREWSELWKSSGRDPFLHPLWHEAFLQAAPHVKPRIIGVRMGGELIALLPLRQDDDGVLRFLTAPRSDYEDVLVSAPHLEPALACLTAFLAAERFDLVEIPEGSPLWGALVARGLAAQPSSPCPGIELTAESARDVTHRKSLLRHSKKLARRGSVRLEPVARQDVDDALQAMFDQHVARRLAAGDDSMFLDATWQTFYHRLVTGERFAELGTFHVLMAGARPVAYHIGLHSAGTFIWYKPTFDLNLQNDGPGEVLLKTLVEHAYSGGLSYFDFSRGSEAFKQRFATTHRLNRRVCHRLPIRGRVRRRLKRAAHEISAWTGAALRGVAAKWPSPPDPQVIALNSPRRVEAPDGLLFEFGDIDLVAFGKLRQLCPEYITTDRMRLAIEAQRRGDQLLVVWDSARDAPLHFALLELDSAPVAPGETGGEGNSASRGVISNLWTAPHAYGRGICAQALSYLAGQSSKSGLKLFMRGLDKDPATRRTLTSAGLIAAQ